MLDIGSGGKQYVARTAEKTQATGGHHGCSSRCMVPRPRSLIPSCLLANTDSIRDSDYVEIDVAQELATAAPELINQTGSYGAVVFRFSGTQARNIYADSMVSMPGHPIAFHFDAIMQDAAFSAGSQESVWWLPLTTTSDFIIISNSGSAGISGTLELYDATGRLSSSAVSIPASQASRIDVGALVRAASFTGTMGGLRLTLPQSGGVVQVAHPFGSTMGFCHPRLHRCERRSCSN